MEKKSKNMKSQKKSTKNKVKTYKAEKKSSESKVIKLNTDFSSKNLIKTKKLKLTVIIIIILFVLLLGRLAFLQFVDGAYLKELAYQQQTMNQIISPKRGNIYDSTEKTLATSAQVDTITINPSKITNDDEEKAKALKEKVAKGLSEIFELDYDEVLAKVTSTAQVETIIKKVEKEKVDKLKTWMKENDIAVGINIDEDTKRYYPYGSFASNLIGCTGSDNQGLSGLESTWNSILTGTPGKIVSSKDAMQEEIPNANETYIAAENGSDLTLTIDYRIQSIVEEHLKQAVIDNNCKRGGNVIVMNPKNGDILAMATYPNYDLNNPFTPNETLAKTYDSLTSDEKNDAIQKMWINKSVAETYEPGSTFKVITASVAIEENITTTDKAGDFYCPGYQIITDANGNKTQINCWYSPRAHGSQDLRHALMNSCNPAFMQLGQRIGAATLYKYYDAFGLFDRTDSNLYGELNSNFWDLDNVHQIELATMSFGQRFEVTPLQMITAISCIANDGVLMKPRIVKQITNTDTGAVTEIEPTKVRQVISKSTSEKVKSMMESVATIGTGKRAAVAGYSIGGKTGTSEPPVGKEDQGYVATYVAISPIEDTQVCLLINLYQPLGDHQGGTVAGPVVSQMLSDILPYLGIPSDSTENSNSNNLIIVPEIRNKTITEAEKILKNAGFVCKYSINTDPNSTLVVDQMPKPGATLSKNSIIMLYGEGSAVATSVSVPNLKNMGASEATSTLLSKNLNINIEGSGTVVSQDPAKDELVPEGTVVKVTLKKN